MAMTGVQRGATLRAVRFTFQAPANARRVALVGEFNSWNRAQAALQRSVAGGWETTLELAPGRYQYRFLVNDDQWFNDPKVAASAPNPYGTTNSVIDVK